jgi:hypothetical protein
MPSSIVKSSSNLVLGRATGHSTPLRRIQSFLSIFFIFTFTASGLWFSSQVQIAFQPPAQTNQDQIQVPSGTKRVEGGAQNIIGQHGIIAKSANTTRGSIPKLQNITAIVKVEHGEHGIKTQAKKDPPTISNGKESEINLGQKGEEDSKSIVDLDSLFVLPYMTRSDNELERKYIKQIHALPPLPHVSGNTTPKGSKKKKSIVAFSLYGDNPKYTNGALDNAKLVKTYYPGWTIRFYVLPSLSQEIVRELKELGAEIMYPPKDMRDIAYGAFWRFLALDDPDAERFISRDSDSRLNARERFAVEEWMYSGKSCHALRDHPYHDVTFNSGLWGCDDGFMKRHNNATMYALVKKFVDDGNCNAIKNARSKENYGCDNLFLDSVIWPMAENDQIGHDSFHCKDYTNSIGFPTPRDSNMQHTGQAFNSDSEPRERDMNVLKRRIGSAKICNRDAASSNFTALSSDITQ